MDARKPVDGDANEQAADAVRRGTERPTPLYGDPDAAWDAWAKQLQKVEPRTLTLLRAAFDAGVVAGRNTSPGSALGRLGASKGGAARAASLTKKRRIEIAKKAAKKRWGD